MKESRPTVHVVDDEEEVRSALQWLLETAGYRVHTYAGAAAFLEAYAPDEPECLVLDVYMPEMTGLALIDTLNQRGARVPVIVVTGHGDVDMAVQALKSGAHDFLQKPFDDEQLLERVVAALGHSENAARRRREHLQTAGQLDSLTPREREVLELLLVGLTSKRIAARLGVSPRTAEVHRARVMQKMGTNSVAELVTRVVRYRDSQRQT